MKRADYIKEIQRFQSVLKALDSTHRLNGHKYTSSEIGNARKAVGLLKCLVDVGVYDLQQNEVAE